MNRIGKAPLLPAQEMEKKMPRGSYEFLSAQRDNKCVTILSSDASVELVKKVKQYDKTLKKKAPIPCSFVIKDYNGRMGGMGKSDRPMLNHP